MTRASTLRDKGGRGEPIRTRAGTINEPRTLSRALSAPRSRLAMNSSRPGTVKARIPTLGCVDQPLVDQGPPHRGQLAGRKPHLGGNVGATRFRLRQRGHRMEVATFLLDGASVDATHREEPGVLGGEELVRGHVPTWCGRTPGGSRDSRGCPSPGFPPPPVRRRSRSAPPGWSAHQPRQESAHRPRQWQLLPEVSHASLMTI